MDHHAFHSTAQSQTIGRYCTRRVSVAAYKYQFQTARVAERLPSVKDVRSLDSLVKVEAADFSGCDQTGRFVPDDNGRICTVQNFNTGHIR